MTDVAEALRFAREIAEVGGRIALGHFGHDPERKRKPDGTWVTEADWAVEAQLRIRIARAWPDHNILGEEEGLTASGGGPPTDGAPTWVLDPIDGTHNYMLGIPVWATLVALRIDDTNVLGVAHAPAIGETYDGAIGNGARFNGTTIEVDDKTTLEDAHYLHAEGDLIDKVGLRPLNLALVDRCWRSRGFGDFWGHMLVARGAAQIMMEPVVALWDVAALEPIVTEAGGRITRVDGSPLDGEEGSCLTTCPSLHQPVLDLLQDVTPGWKEPD
jgi:histidinol-phosphatase